MNKDLWNSLFDNLLNATDKGANLHLIQEMFEKELIARNKIQGLKVLMMRQNILLDEFRKAV